MWLLVEQLKRFQIPSANHQVLSYRKFCSRDWPGLAGCACPARAAGAPAWAASVCWGAAAPAESWPDSAGPAAAVWQNTDRWNKLPDWASQDSLGLAVFQQHVLNFRMLVERRAELVRDFADICQNLLSVKGSFSQSEIHPKFLSLFRCFISWNLHTT